MWVSCDRCWCTGHIGLGDGIQERKRSGFVFINQKEEDEHLHSTIAWKWIAFLILFVREHHRLWGRDRLVVSTLCCV